MKTSSMLQLVKTVVNRQVQSEKKRIQKDEKAKCKDRITKIRKNTVPKPKPKAKSMPLPTRRITLVKKKK
jgi:hypothetical protein